MVEAVLNIEVDEYSSYNRHDTLETTTSHNKLFLQTKDGQCEFNIPHNRLG